MGQTSHSHASSADPPRKKPAASSLSASSQSVSNKISSSLLGGSKSNLQALLTEAVLPTHFQSKPGTDKGSATNDHSYSKHEKRKQQYKVNLPTRMLVILGLIFLVVPVIIFGYKEVHIHDDHQGQSHYKTQKFVNVNTEDVFANFANHSSSTNYLPHKNQTNHSATSLSSGPDNNKNYTSPLNLAAGDGVNATAPTLPGSSPGSLEEAIAETSRGTADGESATVDKSIARGGNHSTRVAGDEMSVRG